MRTTAFAALIVLASCALGGFHSSPAEAAQDKTAKPVAKPVAPAKPGTVPADVRARVISKLHGANPNDVAATPIPGLYEVTMGGTVVYVSDDGKYLVSGNVYDLDTQTNITANRRNAARAAVLASAREDQMIIFSPANPKMTITVFTDVDCGFCRKLHSQIADINKAGVRVRYMMYPRTGPGTESWRKAETVWCSADRKEALTRAKKGEPVKGKECGDAVIKAQYQMGDDLGVEGTPAIFTQNGDYIGGYLAPADLVQAVQDSQKAATGGAAMPVAR
jgi:thiol:disulfide interchange protein DsbC